MDENTLNSHMQNSGREPDSKRFTGDLTGLTTDLFEKLRLYIGFDCLLEWLVDGVDESGLNLTASRFQPC